DILKDENKRKMYDLTGDALSQGPQGDFQRQKQYQNTNQADDIFGDFEKVFNMQGFGRVQKGQDIIVNIDASFLEAINGFEKKVSYTRKGACSVCKGSKCKDGTSPIRCSACAGKGSVNHRQGPMTIQMACSKCNGEGQFIKFPCTNCKGSGLSVNKYEENIKIPRGVQNGQSIKIPRKGNEIEGNGIPGDLIIKILVKEDKFFQRENNDIISQHFITISQAVLGTKIQVKTLDGTKDQDIQPGVQHGDRICIQNMVLYIFTQFFVILFFLNQKKGVELDSGNRGNHYVVIKIIVPQNLSREMRSLYEQLAQVEPKVDQKIYEKKEQEDKQEGYQNQDENKSENIFNKFKKVWGS
ncbi:hypothetical protein IMG5_152740, partial [Ichthyophthirius multifiliis]